LDWGDDFRFQEGDETSYLKLTVNLFKKQAKPDSLASRELIRQQLRTAERMDALRSQGFQIRCERAACAGRLRVTDGPPAASDPGIFVHRNLGIPYLPASNVVRLVKSVEQGRLAAKKGFTAFDALPVTVPRLESDLLPNAITVIPREVADARRAGKRPAELLSVLPGAEFDFWFAAPDAQVLLAASEALSSALALYSTALRVSQDDEPEVEIAAGPVMVPVPDGNASVMIARASTVHYQVHNGRIVAMFRHSAGKDVKAEEHASNIMMTEEVRKRLAKKKLLQEVDIEVEAVGNAWRIRGVRG
jgi:hypothetical protein